MQTLNRDNEAISEEVAQVNRDSQGNGILVMEIVHVEKPFQDKGVFDCSRCQQSRKVRLEIDLSLLMVCFFTPTRGQQKSDLPAGMERLTLMKSGSMLLEKMVLGGGEGSLELGKTDAS